MLKGIGASSGIAIGKVLIKTEKKMVINKNNDIETKDELAKFINALNKAIKQINTLYKNTIKTIGKQEANIFEAHKMILEDPDFHIQVKNKIEKEHVNAEWAVQEVAKDIINIFENIDDDYLKERASDIKDVTNRVMKILLDIELTDLTNLKENVIIAGKDLTPSDTATLDKEKVIGFVIEMGGKTSHSAIMARTLGIPAIVGVNGLLTKIKNGDILAFNGNDGLIYVNPQHSIIERFKKERIEYLNFNNNLKKLIGSKSVTNDGTKVELAANIGTPKDIDLVLNNDAEAVGLFRSEFLYMDRDTLPSEEEQFQAYKVVAQKMNGKSVIIRTLDIGGDKKLDYLRLPKEMNPFLGYRAIRICLDQIDIFKTQLRSLLKASFYGNIKILLPMISCIDELRQAKKIIEQVKSELDSQNIPYNSLIQIGIMIETPAAVLLSDLFAKEVDFFSIGTNDLIQYTIAVDRMNEKISHLYNPYNPSILRAIKTVIDAGHKANIKVGMCGEMASESSIIPILIGMGLDEFSMNPSSILNARLIVQNTSKKNMENIIEHILMLPTAEEVKNYMSKVNNEYIKNV